MTHTGLEDKICKGDITVTSSGEICKWTCGFHYGISYPVELPVLKQICLLYDILRTISTQQHQCSNIMCAIGLLSVKENIISAFQYLNL